MFSDQYHPGRNVLLGEFKRRTEPKYTYDDCSIVHSSEGRIVISNSVSENIQFDFNPITGYSKDGQPNGLLVVSGTTYPVCFTCRERDISSSIHGLAKWRGTNLTRVLELATKGTGYPMIGFASRNRRQEMINRYIMVLKDTLINTDNLYSTIHKFMLDEATIKQVVDALDNRINDGWQRGGNEKLLRDLNKISIDMKKTPDHELIPLVSSLMDVLLFEHDTYVMLEKLRRVETYEEWINILDGLEIGYNPMEIEPRFKHAYAAVCRVSELLG